MQLVFCFSIFVSFVGLVWGRLHIVIKCYGLDGGFYLVNGFIFVVIHSGGNGTSERCKLRGDVDSCCSE